MRERNSIFHNIDWVTIVIFLLLMVIGWVNIYAAVYNDEHKNIFDLTQNYGKQMIWILTSLVLGMVILILDAKFFSAFSYVIYIVLLLVLILVLVIGKEVAGSRSWFEIGNFRLQPSEFAKFATALAMAKYMSALDLNINRLSTRLTAATIILLPASLIILQPDAGSAIVYSAFILVLFREGLSGNFLLFGVAIAILFVLALMIDKFVLIGCLAGIGLMAFLLYKNLRRQFFWIVAAFIVLAGYVYSIDYVVENILEHHQQKRINVLIGKETDIKGAGYNVHQSLIAIGSGGFLGKDFYRELKPNMILYRNRAPILSSAPSERNGVLPAASS